MWEGMHLSAPVVPGDPSFHHEATAPFHYKPFESTPPMYLAMLGNRGVIEGYGVPPGTPVAARSVEDPRYDGEATLLSPPSQAPMEGAGARVVTWTPNHAEIALQGAAPGQTLVYNMNYDDGWTSDGGAVVDADGRVGVVLAGAVSSVHLTYRPTGLVPGLFLGLAGLVGAWLVARRGWPRGISGSESSGVVA